MLKEEWQTEPGKINTNAVSSWVLMSTTHHHLRKKYKRAKRKNEEKDVKYEQHQQHQQ